MAADAEKAARAAAGSAASRPAGKAAGKAAGTATARTVATPWGPAMLVEELRLQQQAGDRRFSSLVQLLESPKGERLVRFAYATNGTARRGPVTLRARDLARLRGALAEHPELKEALDP